MSTLEPCLVVDSLTVEYVTDGYSIRSLDSFSMEAAPGELVALVGPSGSGKTTLLSVLSGMVPATSGTVHMNGTDVLALRGRALENYRRSDIGIVFQGFNLLPSLNARENVAAPLLVAGVAKGVALDRADALLVDVGMGDRLRHKPRELSGGQQQRVAVARGLVADPAMLFADEPTANLDHISAEAVIGLLRELRSTGRTILISTHDTRLLPAVDRIVEMTGSMVTMSASTEPIELANGQNLFRQGDASDLVYSIERGTVEIVRELADGAEDILTVLSAPGYVGELGPLLGFPRSATVRARGEASLRAFTAAEFKSRATTASFGGSQPSEGNPGE